MNKKLMKERFFEAVATAYPGDEFPASRKRALAGTCGDGLADFIYLELDEGIDWDRCEEPAEVLGEAQNLMDRAMNDIMTTISRVETKAWWEGGPDEKNN